MVQLHFNGSVFDLDEDHSVADVFEFINKVAPDQGGETWFKLANGGTVHLQVGDQPSFAVVAPAGYDPLKAAARG